MLLPLDCILLLLSCWEYSQQIFPISWKINARKIPNHLHSNLPSMKQTVRCVNNHVHVTFLIMIDTLYNKNKLFTTWVQQIESLMKLFQSMHKIVRHGQIKPILLPHNFWWLRLFLTVQAGVMSIQNTIFITYFQISIMVYLKKVVLMPSFSSLISLVKY